MVLLLLVAVVVVVVVGAVVVVVVEGAAMVFVSKEEAVVAAVVVEGSSGSEVRELLLFLRKTLPGDKFERLFLKEERFIQLCGVGVCMSIYVGEGG